MWRHIYYTWCLFDLSLLLFIGGIPYLSPQPSTVIRGDWGESFISLRYTISLTSYTCRVFEKEPFSTSIDDITQEKESMTMTANDGGTRMDTHGGSESRRYKIERGAHLWTERRKDPSRSNARIYRSIDAINGVLRVHVCCVAHRVSWLRAHKVSYPSAAGVQGDWSPSKCSKAAARNHACLVPCSPWCVSCKRVQSHTSRH